MLSASTMSLGKSFHFETILIKKAYCSLRNETKWNKMKWKSVVCEMKICSFLNTFLIRCPFSQELWKLETLKNRHDLPGPTYTLYASGM